MFGCSVAMVHGIQCSGDDVSGLVIGEALGVSVEKLILFWYARVSVAIS